MRKLFAGVVRMVLSGLLSRTANVLRKYFHDRSAKDWLFIKKPRGGLFDYLPQRKKQCHAGAAFSALHSRKLVHRSVANLTQHDLVGVQHRKPEGSSFLVVSFDPMANQRHGLYSPRTGTTPRLRVQQLASQINSFGDQPLRKLFYAVIALASIAFRVCSPASGQGA
jgi:hypothetical protein